MRRKRTRKRYEASFKARVAIAAVRADKTVENLPLPRFLQHVIRPPTDCPRKLQVFDLIRNVSGERQASIKAKYRIMREFPLPPFLHITEILDYYGGGPVDGAPPENSRLEENGNSTRSIVDDVNDQKTLETSTNR